MICGRRTECCSCAWINDSPNLCASVFICGSREAETPGAGGWPRPLACVRPRWGPGRLLPAPERAEALAVAPVAHVLADLYCLEPDDKRRTTNEERRTKKAGPACAEPAFAESTAGRFRLAPVTGDELVAASGLDPLAGHPRALAVGLLRPVSGLPLPLVAVPLPASGDPDVVARRGPADRRPTRRRRRSLDDDNPGRRRRLADHHGRRLGLRFVDHYRPARRRRRCRLMDHHRPRRRRRRCRLMDHHRPARPRRPHVHGTAQSHDTDCQCCDCQNPLHARISLTVGPLRDRPRGAAPARSPATPSC